MVAPFEIIAFDADDTLWENNGLYLGVRDRVKQIIARYGDSASMDEQLDEIEIRNLKYYGYGIMGFILSLVEAAIEITGSRISAGDISVIVAMAKDMISAEVRLFNHAEATLRELSGLCPLILITKGDLNHQQAKIGRSGLSQFFREVDVVPDKTRPIYAGILEKLGVAPSRFLMVGNSIRSDILPVLELGGWGVYIPNDFTWVHEMDELPQGFPGRFFELEHLGLLPALIETIES